MSNLSPVPVVVSLDLSGENTAEINNADRVTVRLVKVKGNRVTLAIECHPHRQIGVRRLPISAPELPTLDGDSSLDIGNGHAAD